MQAVKTCASARLDGQPCQAKSLPGEAFCWAHHPAYQERRREGQRRGGQAKATAARAAKAWAVAGREIPDDALPLILKALIVDVRAGAVEPAVAGAIANLAKVSLGLKSDLELEQRISALEDAARESRGPSPLRRFGA